MDYMVAMFRSQCAMRIVSESRVKGITISAKVVIV
jgi:hypothetical protein